MKKLIFLLFAGMCILPSCKKESAITDKNGSISVESKKKPNPTAKLSSQPNLNVSTYGFLVFNTLADFVTFATIIDGATHLEMKTYLASKGFTPRATTIYNSTYDRQLISPTQAIDYVLPASGIISIQGILFRPTNDKRYLLAMKTVYLTSATFNQLAAATLNSSVMNRFNTNQPINAANENLFSFMNRIPYGYVAPGASGGVTEKFWGKKRTNCGLHSSGNCMWEECTVTTYVFWVNTGSEDNVVTPGSISCSE